MKPSAPVPGSRTVGSNLLSQTNISDGAERAIETTAFLKFAIPLEGT